MKITKGRLKQIIKEELDLMDEGSPLDGVNEDEAQAVVDIAANEGELYQMFKQGADIEAIVEAATASYLKFKIDMLKDELMNPAQLDYVAELLSATSTYGGAAEKDLEEGDVINLDDYRPASSKPKPEPEWRDESSEDENGNIILKSADELRNKLEDAAYEMLTKVGKDVATMDWEELEPISMKIDALDNMSDQELRDLDPETYYGISESSQSGGTEPEQNRDPSWQHQERKTVSRNPHRGGSYEKKMSHKAQRQVDKDAIKRGQQ